MSDTTTTATEMARRPLGAGRAAGAFLRKNGTVTFVPEGFDPDEQPPAILLPPPNAPMAVARELADRDHRDELGRLHLHHHRGGFLSWQGSHWREAEDRSVRADAYWYTEQAKYVDEKGQSKPWAPNRYKVADLLDALAAITHLSEQVQPPAWTEPVPDAPPANELVACRNGLLHITTRELLQHTPCYFNFVSTPFSYNPKAGAPTRWLEFLDDLWKDDPDAIAALQEWFGYVLSGRTDLHKILLLVGPMRGGKGTIARVLRQLVGPGNVVGPTLASMGTNFGLQELVNRPLAIVSDARLGKGSSTSVVVERLLSISGEDALTIDRKYKDPWTGQLPTRFMIVSNELPMFGDASGAIASRFVVLTLRESWLGRENADLTKELLSELPGILNWALDGLERLQERRRFTEPASSRDATTALQDLVSPVAAFVRERCTRGPTEEVAVEMLYTAWKNWAEDNGHRPGSTQSFGQQLRAVVPGLFKVRPWATGSSERPRHYRGLRLGTTEEFADTDGTVGTDPSDQDLRSEFGRTAVGTADGTADSLSPNSPNSPNETPLFSSVGDEFVDEDGFFDERGKF